MAGVEVNFTIRAGDGNLSSPSAITDGGGIASVQLTLGQHTAANPTYWHDSPYSWQVGVNIVDGATPSGLRPCMIKNNEMP